MSEQKASLGVIFAGGGSGGHVFPALAVREQLLRLHPDGVCVILASEKAIDRQILDAAGVEWRPTRSRPFGARPMTLLRFVTHWGAGVREARAAIRDVKEHAQRVALVTVGGYVAAPAAQAAKAERVPVVMLNLDAAPGKANRWIARRAALCLTTAQVEGRPGWRRLAPIVRAGAVSTDTPEACRTRLGLNRALPTLLVTGASQGAASINGAMAELAAREASLFAGWQVFHQCGQGGEAALRAAYDRAGVSAVVVAFCDDMASAWRAAEAAVSRAGAGSVAEAWANATPTVFLPFPYHKDEHQRRNAAPLVDAGGAVTVRDAIEPKANADALVGPLRELLSHQGARARMRAALEGLGPVDGAIRAAEAVAALVRAGDSVYTPHPSK